MAPGLLLERMEQILNYIFFPITTSICFLVGCHIFQDFNDFFVFFLKTNISFPFTCFMQLFRNTQGSLKHQLFPFKISLKIPGPRTPYSAPGQLKRPCSLQTAREQFPPLNLTQEYLGLTCFSLVATWSSQSYHDENM